MRFLVHCQRTQMQCKDARCSLAWRESVTRCYSVVCLTQKVLHKRPSLLESLVHSCPRSPWHLLTEEKKWSIKYMCKCSQSRKPDPLSQEKGRVQAVIVPHCTVQYNHSTVFCHMTHYITVLSRNSSLENGERVLGHLFCYCRSCKNTSYFLGNVLTPQQVNSKVHYLKSGYRRTSFNCENLIIANCEFF